MNTERCVRVQEDAESDDGLIGGREDYKTG